MRKHTLKVAIAVAGLVGAMAACNNDTLTNYNVDPNNPATIQPALLFTNGTLSGMFYIRNTSFEHGLASLWVQHYAEVQYPEADLYIPRDATVEALWSNLYVGGLEDYRKLLATATDPQQIAPALIMRSFIYHEMTDLWGDIPYTDANAGDKGAASLTPAYDAQKVIYDSLFAAYKTAAGLLVKPGTDYGSADPIYGGNRTKWLKLNNALHARAALRLSKRDPARAQAELVNALTKQGVLMSSNADNAKFPWVGDGVNDNPLFTNWETRDDQRISQTFVDSLKSYNDPRLAQYADSTTNSTGDACAAKTPAAPAGCAPVYVGAENGRASQPAGILASTSRPNIKLREANSPAYIMTYAELLFIEAEAAQRGWVTTLGSAASLYDAAITASMQQWGVSDTEIAAYLLQPKVAYSPATGLQQIAMQKWIALFNQENDAFAEWRRTGIPALTPGIDASYPAVPRRLGYPPIESSLNETNVKAAAAAQGGAAITNRVWWDTP
jgi:hypothetical protein